MKRRGAIVALLAAAGVAALDVRGEEKDPWLVPVEHVTERVERIRGHRFQRVPSVDVLSRREMDREVAADLGPNSKRRRGAILALSLAGVGDARELESGSPLKGFAPSAGRVLISRELLERDPVEAEAVLAHELTHALEVEQFELDQLPWDWLVDYDAARSALLEGTAMLVESEYRIRHQGVRARPHAYARRSRGAPEATSKATPRWPRTGLSRTPPARATSRPAIATAAGRRSTARCARGRPRPRRSSTPELCLRASRSRRRRRAMP